MIRFLFIVVLVMAGFSANAADLPGLDQITAYILASTSSVSSAMSAYEPHVAIMTNQFYASNLVSGSTIPVAAVPSLAGSIIGSGTVNAARLPDLSGTYEAHVATLTNKVYGTNVTSGGTLATALMPALTGDVTTSAGGVATTLATGNAGNLNSGTLLAARMPALTGDITTSAGAVATTLAAGNAGNLNSGTLLAARMPAHTGDVTSNAGSVALTLAAGSAANLNSGTLLAARMPALTGDVTTSAGTVATMLALHPFTWSGNTGNALVGAGVTAYYAVCGNSATNVLTSDTSAATRNVLTHTVTLGPLYVVMNPAAGSGKTDTVTVMTNGVATSIVVSLANTLTGNDTIHLETDVAGVEVGIKIVTASASTASKFSWGLEGK